mmetsp:Transcript_16915/g.47211  ORF Transcript_16915/g.47211 Transcript_16915/m.47211 type:complete len:206 (+) Transcript_16915:659-1276(+)
MSRATFGAVFAAVGALEGDWGLEGEEETAVGEGLTGACSWAEKVAAWGTSVASRSSSKSFGSSGFFLSVEAEEEEAREMKAPASTATARGTWPGPSRKSARTAPVAPRTAHPGTEGALPVSCLDGSEDSRVWSTLAAEGEGNGRRGSGVPTLTVSLLAGERERTGVWIAAVHARGSNIVKVRGVDGRYLETTALAVAVVAVTIIS